MFLNFLVIIKVVIFLNKTKEKYIGLVCQNETFFQDIFNKIYLNMRNRKDDFFYRFISFSDTKKISYDYIIHINNPLEFNINFIRFYLNYNNTIGIINIDKIELEPFKNIGNIISYGVNQQADFYVNNIYYNDKIFVCNIYHNEVNKELYCALYNKEDIYYIISIIILLLNERYNYEDIKEAIQKVGH